MYIPMAGQGASRGLRALLSSPKARVTSRGSWAAPQSLGAPAANPSSPGAAAGSRRLCWSDNPHPSAGCGDPLGPAAARQLPAHGRHTLTHTDTHTHAPADTHTRQQTRTNPPGRSSPRSPQQRARLQRGGRSGRPREQAIPLPAARFLQEKPPRRPKNKVNFKVMQIVMQRFFFPPPFAWKKNRFPQLEEKKKKRNQSANGAQRGVSVARGGGWTGQQPEEENPERGTGKQMMVCLQVAFGARFAGGMQRELAAPAPASTLPRNGSPRRRRESER